MESKLQIPYLIQRCTVKIAEGKKGTPPKDLRTSEYLSFDYMGAAEFEFGAVQEFYLGAHKKIPNLQIYNFKHVHGLEFFYACEEQNKEAYANFLNEMIGHKIRLKEPTRFDAREIFYEKKDTFRKRPIYDDPRAPYSFTVWLDYTNNLFFSREKKITENLMHTLKNSGDYMIELRKAKGLNG